MIVVLDNPQPLYYGGLSAAPVFRNIALRWLSVNPELANKEIHSKNKKL
jgi:hypothetical protein